MKSTDQKKNVLDFSRSVKRNILDMSLEAGASIVQPAYSDHQCETERLPLYLLIPGKQIQCYLALQPPLALALDKIDLRKP